MENLSPYDGLDEFFGSLIYALVNAHYGVFQTRRDGIFGLAYETFEGETSLGR